ncbi:hypothetical protein HMF8227_00841 [Saliniradius amylolyticus]|uniref:Phage shock protein PspC N-terminal domain-containing protein n=1 Tax=Saliniradius amylolyticus TaxID=2183582 RepID=A0A2S2E144_9ALTE|nr:envelope stress response membrane protein PspC [Saliniradius amylolyticus]AWL11336.1 hypothetical protein HMF8227_00841 [Saliniradius amylolyticus]
MKRNGELYRHPQKGKIAGVCAGLADYFGWEVWLIRIALVSAVLLAGPFFVIAYIAAWFILDKAPASNAETQDSSFGKGWQSSDEEAVEIKSRVWRAGESPRHAFQDIKHRFEHLEHRLRAMETYVTSSEFQLHREIDRL